MLSLSKCEISKMTGVLQLFAPTLNTLSRVLRGGWGLLWVDAFIISNNTTCKVFWLFEGVSVPSWTQKGCVQVAMDPETFETQWYRCQAFGLTPVLAYNVLLGSLYLLLSIWSPKQRNGQCSKRQINLITRLSKSGQDQANLENHQAEFYDR